MEDEEKNRLRAGWSHHEESRVHHSPGCRNDLASSSVERLLSDDCIQDLKLHIPDGWGQQKHWVMATDHWWGITHFPCAKCLMLKEKGGKKREVTELTLITERAFPGAPLETLNNAVFDWAEQRLVHLQRGKQDIEGLDLKRSSYGTGCAII